MLQFCISDILHVHFSPNFPKIFLRERFVGKLEEKVEYYNSAFLMCYMYTFLPLICQKNFLQGKNFGNLR